MSRPALTEGTVRWAPLANLLLPGAGLILLGSTVSGLLVGVAFAACANFALAAVLLFPDDYSETLRALAIGVAGGAYVGAQVRLAGTLRRRRAEAEAERRRRGLRAAEELLAGGAPERAVEVLQELASGFGDDLLIAYRLAQAWTAAGNDGRARLAWREVRRLDRYGIYRRQIADHEQKLRAQ
ncbi:MAG TPA: hypothetical protein PLP66_11960 [Phycisphaerae bacterium]|jgi:hypothetical protein|nr:hypothetical protein [Phycisphaerae bacterium]HPM24613.1 hypothetical protein [Phycisphaerae bacterium]HQL53653.1 hypothetical protein [Phycisphaerae bacterium]